MDTSYDKNANLKRQILHKKFTEEGLVVDHSTKDFRQVEDKFIRSYLQKDTEGGEGERNSHPENVIDLPPLLLGALLIYISKATVCMQN